MPRVSAPISPPKLIPNKKAPILQPFRSFFEILHLHFKQKDYRCRRCRSPSSFQLYFIPSWIITVVHSHNFIQLLYNILRKSVTSFTLKFLYTIVFSNPNISNIQIIKMQFSTLFFAAAAATLASAVQLTNPSFEVTAGSPFNITWSDAQGPVTLVLMNGPSTSLNSVSTIGSGLTGTSFTWTPPATLDSSLYAIRIEDSTSTPNYSEQFQVSGATAAASTVTASSTSVSSSETASSTSGSSTTVSSTSESSSSSTSSSAAASSAASSSAAASSSSAAASSSSSITSSNSTSTASRSSSSSSSTTRSLTTTASRTSTSTTAGSTSSATSAPTSAAAEFSSPLAFVFLAFAAIVTLN
ncbi:fee7f65a-6057-4708-942a-0dcb1e76a076 [Sclerotinia trifoliorum]|uniref:Fee7f65a-6057-4708-942a-0dcb1e76a076 n=1 Tax=Sclerotinia trifoliorum TaxID=28548 RepID=A0A8H2ZR29_9HELO|nr:fee7f65a-6057-4708-942a-0dcb1e76a076 [Sclerotinia trifoliorum]